MNAKTVVKVFKNEKLRIDFSKTIDDSIRIYMNNVYKAYKLDEQDPDYSIRKFSSSVFSGSERMMSILNPSIEEFISNSMELFDSIPEKFIKKKCEDSLVDKFMEIFLIAKTIECLRNKFNSIENKKEAYILFLMIRNNMEMFANSVYEFTYNKIVQASSSDPAKNIRIDMSLFKIIMNEYYIDFMELNNTKKKFTA